MECNTHTPPPRCSLPPSSPVLEHRGPPPPPSRRPCASPDSPRSGRRLASSPARVGGKVGRQEERRDERGQGAQKATRAEGREERQKGGAERRREGVGRWRGAGNERREAPDPAGLRRGKRAARRLQRRGPLETPSPPRIWGRRGSYLTRRCGPASGEFAVACAGGRAPASPAPARRRAPGGAARAPRPALDSRGRSAPGAFSPGGNNGAEAGAPEAGRGEGSRPLPGVSRPCAPPLQTRRRRLTLLAARAPSPGGAPGAAACPTAVLVPCALRGAPRTGESPRSPLLFQLWRALAAGEGEVAAMR